MPSNPDLAQTLPPHALRAALAVAWCLVGGSPVVLVTRRPPGKRFAGLWEWPGGKVEPGESAAQAACRELAEETGLTADPALAEALGTHVDPGPPPIAFSVLTIEMPGCPAAAAIGCSDARWMPIDEALELAFPPANAAINALVRARLKEARSGPPEGRPSQAR